jgi:hypothetical protein
VVDSNNAHGLGSEQMSDMEARCADSAFPAAREAKQARGPMRETNADALFVCTILAYDKFSSACVFDSGRRGASKKSPMRQPARMGGPWSS